MEISLEPKESMRIAAAAPLRNQVADRMRLAIAEGTFRAGERLLEKDLCERLGVSRTSVREALRQLESEGLVATVPNKGPIVATIDLKDAENIYETRAVLEGLLGRLFARRGSQEMMFRLKQAFDEMARAYGTRDLSQMVAAKSELYAVLIEGAANDVAAAALRAIHIRAMQFRAMSLSQPGRADKSLAEVRRFVEAIMAHDEDEAWSAGVEHVRNAGGATLQMFRDRLTASS
ncbi:GntR family transcriptional regulator [Aquabacter sp. CN5-332]|uniref:GntR family transcriptional regulator n=1 Tax=Aquabacter sp. CN5-332 TaxID=3156608 RepID=UPI0032B54467